MPRKLPSSFIKPAKAGLNLQPVKERLSQPPSSAAGSAAETVPSNAANRAGSHIAEQLTPANEDATHLSESSPANVKAEAVAVQDVPQRRASTLTRIRHTTPAANPEVKPEETVPIPATPAVDQKSMNAAVLAITDEELMAACAEVLRNPDSADAPAAAAMDDNTVLQMSADGEDVDWDAIDRIRAANGRGPAKRPTRPSQGTVTAEPSLAKARGGSAAVASGPNVATSVTDRSGSGRTEAAIPNISPGHPTTQDGQGVADAPPEIASPVAAPSHVAAPAIKKRSTLLDNLPSFSDSDSE